MNEPDNTFADLDLPDTFHENDFRRGLVREMREFILELGKDFTFIGEEYPIQIGEEDYRIDLLFFHRSLQWNSRRVNSSRSSFPRWTFIWRAR